MQKRFTDSIIFTDDEIAGARKKWTYSLIDKLLGKSLPIEFLTKELKAQWATTRDFNIVPLFTYHMVFRFNKEESRVWVMANGPWMITGRVPTLEPWRPNFSTREDTLQPRQCYGCGSHTSLWRYGNEQCFSALPQLSGSKAQRQLYRGGCQGQICQGLHLS